MPSEFSILRRVQFAETDTAGVAHFANYFRWMEEVEHAFFRSLGLSVVMQHDGREIGWPRVAVECQYTAPARFEDELTLTLRLSRVGEKSVSYEVEFLREGQRLALGKLTSICCSVEAGGKFTSISIPTAIRQKFES